MPIIENVYTSEELAMKYQQAKRARPELTYPAWHAEQARQGDGPRYGDGTRLGGK